MTNQKGMTLVSVLVATAVGAIAMVFFSSFFVNMFKQQQRVTFGNEVAALVEEIRGLLSSEVSCTNTFRGLALNSAMDHSVTRIVDASPSPGVIRYDMTTVYGDGTIRLSKLNFNNYRPSVDRSGDATFVVGFANQGTGGVSEIGRTIEIRTESDAAGNLESCVATSKMTDGLWRRNMVNINNIFYTAPSTGGDVGIGLDSPAERLHVHNGGDQGRVVISGTGGGSDAFSGVYLSETSANVFNSAWGISYKNTNPAFTPQSLAIGRFNSGVESHRLVIKPTGEVGLGGVTNPEGDLHVYDDDDQSAIVISGAGDGNETYSALYFARSGMGALDRSWVLAYKKNPPPGTNPDAFQIAMWNGGSMASQLVIDPSGNVGIGNDRPQERLQVGGSLRIDGVSTFNGEMQVNGNVNVTGTVTAASDVRLKKNIFEIKDQILDLISLLNPITYEWIDNSHTGTQFGFIAQEIEKIFPEFVVTNKAGVKSINYNSFSAILVKAVQELSLQNKNINEENKKLSKKLKSFEIRLKALERQADDSE